ncbi:unnamed protein product [Rhizophagus irregularis]|nr:unnamed protein product [Rhizophagus irregularis]
MLQDISNLLIFDIDEEQEIYNDNNMNFSDTYFPQFFIQSLYNFNNEFGDDHQLNCNVIYSKELRDLDDKFRNDHQHRSITTQDDIELPDIDLEETEEAEELELKTGLTFINWAEFNVWIDNFAKNKGFSYKIKISQKNGEIIRRISYECSKSGIHNPQVSSDPTKRQNATSQCTQCHLLIVITIFLLQIYKKWLQDFKN